MEKLRNLKNRTKTYKKPANQNKNFDFILQSLSNFQFKTKVYKIHKNKEETTIYPKTVVDNNNNEIIIDKTVVSVTNKKVKEMESPKGKVFNLMFFLVNILVLVAVLIYQINTYDVISFSELLTLGANFNFVYLAIGVFACIMCLETVRTHVLILKATKASKPIVSYKSVAICRYYDCLTPFTSGGQSFQAFYLSNRGIRGGVATSVAMAKYMFHQIAFLIISALVLVFGFSYIQPTSTVLISLGSIGLCWSIISLSCMIFLSLSKKLAPKIIMSLLKFASKLKIVKDPRKTFIITMRQVMYYQRSIKYFARTWWVALVCIFNSVGIVLLQASIPFFIYCAFATPSFQVAISIFVKFVICELAVKIIPLPGGSGVAEISFAALFGALFSEGTLFWALLIWRFFSYYLYLLQGMFVIIYDFVYGNRRNGKRLKGKQKLGLNITKRK